MYEQSAKRAHKTGHTSYLKAPLKNYQLYVDCAENVSTGECTLELFKGQIPTAQNLVIIALFGNSSTCLVHNI
jgi:hypothetical protein